MFNVSIDLLIAQMSPSQCTVCCSGTSRVSLCVLLDCVFVCRWLEAHHQAEALGTAGGAGWQVRVAPRRSTVLHWLPDSHAGARPREESHCGRVPAPPLARPLVEPSSHCTSLSLLSRDCNRSLSSLGISDEYLFLFCFHCFGFLMFLLLMLLCMFALYLLVLLSLCADDARNPVGCIILLLCWLKLLCSIHQFKQTCYCNASDSSLFGFTPALNPKQIKDM